MGHSKWLLLADALPLLLVQFLQIFGICWSYSWFIWWALLKAIQGHNNLSTVARSTKSLYRTLSLQEGDSPPPNCYPKGKNTSAGDLPCHFYLVQIHCKIQLRNWNKYWLPANGFSCSYHLGEFDCLPAPHLSLLGTEIKETLGKQ